MHKNFQKRFEIVFKLYEQANSFVTDQIVQNIDENWIAYVPDFAIYHIGIIRDVPIQLSGQELFEGLSQRDSTRIKRIIRCYKPKSKSDSKQQNSVRLEARDEWVPANEVKIFCSSNLPNNISIFKVSRKVYKYILPIRR